MKSAVRPPSSLNVSTCGCLLSQKNASMNSIYGHRSNSGEMLPFFCSPSSSLRRCLPRDRGTLGLRCIMPRNISTLKSKAPVNFPYRFCRLGLSCVSMNLDTLYTHQHSCLLVRVLVMHMPLELMAGKPRTREKS